MNILFVTDRFPWPIFSGDSSTAYYLIKQLSERNRIYLVSFIREEREEEFSIHIKNFCASIKTVLLPEIFSKGSILERLFSRYPMPFKRSYSPKMKEIIKETLLKEDIDIVHINSLKMGIYFLDIDRPKIFALRDSYAYYLGQLMKYQKGDILEKINLVIYYQRVRNYEKDLVNKLGTSVVVAKEDRDFLRHYTPKADIRVIPIGVDTEFFSIQDTKPKLNTLIFTGNMSYPPNADAVVYFYKEIFPLIKRKMPEVRFYVVGRFESQILSSKAKDIIFTGFVPDIRPYLREASVFVCPLRFGTGMKNKILEAMAMGKPIVATKKSLSGIDFEDKKHLLIADNPEDFAQKVTLLLKNENLCQQLGRQARSLVTEKYTWTRVTEEYQGLYEEALDVWNMRNNKF
ncbi:MAG: glycosyltransferase [Candidatus Omnitrophica bacterium]|nr:glycosyltransferase [Candidatus Omnitrophota bacterium]